MPLLLCAVRVGFRSAPEPLAWKNQHDEERVRERKVTAAQLTGVHTSVAVARESRSVAEGDEEVSGGAPGREGGGERRNGDWLFARLRPSRRPKRKERIVAWCQTTGWYQIDPSNLRKVFNRLLA